MDKKLKSEIRKIEVFVALVVLALFAVAGGKYFYRPLFAKYQEYSETKRLQKVTQQITRVNCDERQNSVQVSGGLVCVNTVYPDSVNTDIFVKYPLRNDGKESPYKFLNTGDIKTADLIVENRWVLPRYEEVVINPPIDWNRSYVNERYWNFVFLSLRETRHLLYAWTQTGNDIYKDKLLEILDSYFAQEDNSDYLWSDYHGVSYRALILTNTWWKLRQYNQLPMETSDNILKSLKKHGDFLRDPNHYEAEHNHGITEATALLTLSTNFPELENASEWNEVAVERITRGLNTLVDKDGVLIENSPYYHFYTLEKYWDLYRYTRKHNLDVSDQFKDRIDKMVSYATYILLPNLDIPTMGASLYRNIKLDNTYDEISKEYPEFRYVLTKGQEGIAPSKRNITYPDSGQVIMRSGWPANNYESQTQLVFDVGDYRTEHSDYDALNFTLYSGGRVLIPDPGLYTYEDGADRNYFHGTNSHNTVIVDNSDQQKGSAILGEFKEDDGYVYQSAAHTLYDDVVHKRAITLVDDNLIIIVDELSSDESHNYSQRFNLSPDSQIRVEGYKVVVFDKNRNTEMTLYQLDNSGITFHSVNGENNPVGGFCSLEYGKKVPCEQLRFDKNGKSAKFVTVIEIGGKSRLGTSLDQNGITLSAPDKTVNIKINNTEAIEGGVSIQKANSDQTKTADSKLNNGNVVIVFDDGYESILPAVDILEKYGFKANVAVIGDYVQSMKRGYLSVQQLRRLQDILGWDIVNHSYNHKNATEIYAEQKDGLLKFEKDILSGAEFLEDNGINSNPNWYIYPFGSFDEKVQAVVSKYYTFGRSTTNGLESFPFSDNLAVRAISTDKSYDNEGSSNSISTDEIISEIKKAQEDNKILFLTFHRINHYKYDKPGYPSEDFEKIIKLLYDEQINTLSFSELDSLLGIPKSSMVFKKYEPSQLKLEVSTRNIGLAQMLKTRIFDKANGVLRRLSLR